MTSDLKIDAQFLFIKQRVLGVSACAEVCKFVQIIFSQLSYKKKSKFL